ncbi:MAG: hypothetical protein MUC63_00745 [Planctomycetes bacterium]|nr:hypothetical protein [Planctomycetota bacterium]
MRNARVEDFAGPAPEGSAPFLAFRWLSSSPAVVADLKAVEAKTRAFARSLLRVEAGEVRCRRLVLYEVLEGELFEFEAEVPEGFSADEVSVGGAQGEWKPSADRRRLLFSFPKPLPRGSRFQVALALRAPFAGEGERALPIPAPRAGASEEEGVIAVSAPSSLRVRDQGLSGLSTLDPGSQIGVFRIWDPELQLAYRYDRHPYAGTLVVAPEQPLVNLASTVFYALRGSSVHVAAHLQFHVRKAGVKAVAFLVPPAVKKGVAVRGEGVKPATQTETPEGVLWTVPLDEEAMGVYDLYVSFPSEARGAGPFALPWVRGRGVSTESGIVAVETSQESELLAEVQGLEAIEPDELEEDPAFAGGAKILSAWKFSRPGWSVSLRVTRHEAGRVAEVVVERLEGTVQVDPAGGEKAEAVFRIRESGIQDFGIELPEGAELWSLTVDGAGVKPAKQGSRLLVPLEPRGPTRRTLAVVYRIPGARPGLLEDYRAFLPRPAPRRAEDASGASALLPVPVLASFLRVAVPEDFHLLGTSGSMAPVFTAPRPRSVLRRLYEKFKGLAVLLVAGVLAGVALIAFRERIARIFRGRAAPAPVLVRVFVGGSALMALLVVLMAVFGSSLGKSRDEAPAPSERAPGARMAKDGSKPYSGYPGDTSIRVGGGPNYGGGRYGGRRNLRSGLAAVEGEEATGREIFENEKEVDVDQPPIEDPVLKDAEVTDHNETENNEDIESSKGVEDSVSDKPFQGRMRDPAKSKTPRTQAIDELQKVQKRKTAADDLKEEARKSREGKEEAQAAGKRLEKENDMRPKPAVAQPPGLPANEPGAPRQPARPGRGGEDPGRPAERKAGEAKGEPLPADQRVGPVRGQGTGDDATEIGLRASSVEAVDTRGLRALAVGLEPRGEVYAFLGEGGEDRVRLFLLGRARRHALGFAAFFAGFFLPLALFRWRPAASVAGLGGTLLGLSLLPELVPGFSGVCNLGVAGIAAGLLLAGILAAARWAGLKAGLPAAPAALLFALALLAAPGARAGEPFPAPADDPVIYIPYDPARAGEGGIPVEKVYLPYREYLRLWDLAHPEQAVKPLPPAAPWAHVEAQYEGEVGPEWFTGRAVIRVRSFSEAAVEIPMGLSNAMVESVKVNGREAALRQTLAGYSYVAPGPGAYAVEIAFRARAAGEGKTGTVEIGLHPVPRSAAVVRLEDPVLTCEAVGLRGAFEQKRGPEGETLTAWLGAADRLSLAWRPKKAEKGSEIATLKATSVTRLVVEPGLQRVHHRCAFEVVGPARDRFRFALAPDLKILRVEGPKIRAWGFKDADGQRTLEIHLLEPEPKEAAWVLEGVRAADPAAPSASMPLLRPMDCMQDQERGSLVVECPAALRLTVEKREGLQPEDLRGVTGLEHPPAAAFRFSRRPVELAYSLEERPARLEGRAAVVLMLGPEDARLAASFLVDSNGAPAWRLAFRLPEGYRLDRVESRQGPAVRDWWVAEAPGARTLHVALEKGLKGPLHLALWMSGKSGLEGGARDVPLPVVAPEGFERVQGRILMLAFEGIRLETRALKGVEPADPAEAWGLFCERAGRGCPPLAGQALAFRFDAKEYSGAVLAEVQKPALSCRWTLHQRLRADAAEYGLYFTFRAERAPATSLSFSLPDWIPPDRVAIFCPAKREEERAAAPGGRVVYRVGLQTGFLGEWRLAVAFRTPLEASGTAKWTAPVPAAAPEGVGDGKVEGWLVVEKAESAADAAPSGALKGLEPVAAEVLAREGALPPGLRETDATFAYRLQRDWSAAFDLEAHKGEKGVDVEVYYIDQWTSLAREGASWNRVELKVMNRSRQFLEVRMPDGAELLSLFVAGGPAKPGRGQGGAVLVPLPQGTPADPAVSVQMTYALRYPPLSTARSLALKHPVVADPAVKVGSVLWQVRLPDGYVYRFRGDMEEAEEARLEEQKLQQAVRDTGQFLEKIEKLPPALQARGIFANDPVVLSNIRKLDELEGSKKIGREAAQRLRAQIRDQGEALEREAAQVLRRQKETERQEAERDIRRNADRFTENQAGLNPGPWAMLEPGRADWEFGEDLSESRATRPDAQAQFAPGPLVPPPPGKGGASLDIPLAAPGGRDFAFRKEGKTAELLVLPWREDALGWAGTAAKAAGLAAIFLAALALGWLKAGRGWAYREFWIWTVLLVAAGASLSSWVFALACGGIAGTLIWRARRAGKAA